jgi:hypothetical protein
VGTYLDGRRDVVLDVTLREGGRVKEVGAVDGDPAPAEAAVSAVKQWRLSASGREGMTLETSSTATISHIPTSSPQTDIHGFAVPRPRGAPAWEDISVSLVHDGQRSFRAKVEGLEKGRTYIVLPFEPADVWGARPRYHVTGAINGRPVRGALEPFGRGYFLALGPAYRRGAGLEVGDPVTVVLAAEGPQRKDLAADIVEALHAEPEAAKFFDGLASFYRKNYLRWIDATKRRPEVRAERIAELIRLLKAGEKQRRT